MRLIQNLNHQPFARRNQSKIVNCLFTSLTAALFSYSVIQLFSYYFRRALLGSVILFITACTNHSAVIKGTLPSEQYDNEIVYWVPFKGASSETVDSTLIRKNRFRIVISAHNLNKIGVIRVKPHLRLALQEILVYTEVGTVQVKLDSISSASGTPLNEVLQNWKDKKRIYDKETYNLRRKLRVADANDKTGIQENIDNLSTTYYNDVFQIVLDSRDNDVGKFIFSLHQSKFTPEQIRESGLKND